MTGADLICAVLGQLGVSTVFGLPGTQNIVLYEAMRRAGLRSVTASDEGAAAFMANGYARASPDGAASPNVTRGVCTAPSARVSLSNSATRWTMNGGPAG